jgi:FkbM family methyltransferase
LSNKIWIERRYGPASYRLYCDLDNDKRARKISDSLPGYIYPLSHFLWANLVNSINWDRIIDIGANYGEFSLDALLYTENQNTKVVCFEPSRSTFYFLAKTLMPFGSRVELNNFGISSENKILTFRESPESSGGSRILDETAPASSSVRHYPVNFYNLNLWLEKPGKVLVKLDVEGHEPEILDGIDLSHRKDLCFFLEVNQIDLDFLQRRNPSLNLYIFSRYRGRLIRAPRIRNVPNFIQRYRDLYLQDAFLVHSDFTDGVAAIEKLEISVKQRLAWLLSKKIDIFSFIRSTKN